MEFALDNLFADLFPDSVVGASATQLDVSDPLFPEEEPFVAKAVEKRRNEFQAGRTCARRALALLGFEKVAIPADSERVPIWPEGVVGSIAHCKNFCAAVVARRSEFGGIGFDAEPAKPLRDALRQRVCRHDELLRADQLGLSVDVALLIFSAKESFYKCYFPRVRKTLGFQDVEVELDPVANRFTARLVADDAPDFEGRRQLTGRFAIRDAFVFTGVTAPP